MEYIPLALYLKANPPLCCCNHPKDNKASCSSFYAIRQGLRHVQLHFSWSSYKHDVIDLVTQKYFPGPTSKASPAVPHPAPPPFPPPTSAPAHPLTAQAPTQLVPTLAPQSATMAHILLQSVSMSVPPPTHAPMPSLYLVPMPASQPAAMAHIPLQSIPVVAPTPHTL
eukprot:3033373-Ditylum_brightwellii.AAC.1